jgi:outer membrane biogenesis lipoprotein LolB
MKKELIALALLGLATATLAGCTTLTDLTPEERAALQAKQRAGKVEYISFEDLKEATAAGPTDPQ